jgi:hypothetical protein
MCNLGRGGWELTNGTSFRGLRIINKCHFVLYFHDFVQLLCFAFFIFIKYFLGYPGILRNHPSYEHDNEPTVSIQSYFKISHKVFVYYGQSFLPDGEVGEDVRATFIGVFCEVRTMYLKLATKHSRAISHSRTSLVVSSWLGDPRKMGWSMRKPEYSISMQLKISS